MADPLDMLLRVTQEDRTQLRAHIEQLGASLPAEIAPEARQVARDADDREDWPVAEVAYSLAGFLYGHFRDGTQMVACMIGAAEAAKMRT
jgi:hypothetical protein